MSSKEKIRKEDLEQQMRDIKTQDYSVDDHNELVLEVNELDNAEEGEELPFRISRFCQEYVIHYNEEKAAQKAGYSIWNASAAGSRLLSNPKVRKEIQRLQKQISNKLQITQERVLSEYAKIAYANVQDLLNDDGTLKNLPELDRDTAAIISGLKFGVKKVKDNDGNEKLVPYIKDLTTIDKKSALDSLAKHLGLFDQDPDRKIPVDLKTFISMLPKEIQESIKLGLAKKIGRK